MKRDLDGQLENYRVTREMADEIRPLLDENRKYRKAIEAMKWRPIDTAPLDGAEVDLWIRADDRRMTLKQAAALFFGDARHAATLRVEIDRGNLVASKIGRAYWTTLPALQEMEAKCRVEAQARGSGGTAAGNPGPSSTDDPTVAQGSALRTLNELKEHFGTTSKASTSRPKVRNAAHCGHPRSLRGRAHQARRLGQTHPLRHRTFEQMVGNEKSDGYLRLLPGVRCTGMRAHRLVGNWLS
jgi:hypothetical protein